MSDIILTSRTGKTYAHRDRDGFLVPATWDEVPCKILAEKYRRKAGVPNKVRLIEEDGIPLVFSRAVPTDDATFGGETSALRVFERMVAHWLYWSHKYGYVTDEEHGRDLYDALVDDLYYQRASGNSPQWFNTGLFHSYGIKGDPQGNWRADHETGEVFPCDNAYEYPQTSACFINGLTDDLLDEGGIMDLFTREARLFKGGSGSGANYSALRAEGEPLSGGGVSSGMMSFLRVGDTNAGAIKSGGTTRRAARNVVVDAEHPDILEFIAWKAKEEDKVHALVAGGDFDYDWQGDAYRTVQGQNANNNVFMDAQAIIDDAVIEQTYRTTGEVVGGHTARQIVRAIAEANHKSGDPGVMFRDTVNAWHTVPHVAPIVASNPCVTGDTLVHTDRGLVRIDELVNRPRNWVTGSDGCGHLTGSAVAMGVKPVFELKTASGRSIKATSDHRFLMSSGEDVELCELKQGDSLAMWTSNREDFADYVLSITPAGEEMTYDINEYETSHFVGNGFVVHNCQEYLSINDTACNLASLNLKAFFAKGLTVEAFAEFTAAVRRWTQVLEWTVAGSSYPSKAIAENTWKIRNLGLGYANLGGLLMSMGIGYDSAEGRKIAAQITSHMTAIAYDESARMAVKMGEYAAYSHDNHAAVMLRHHAAATAHHDMTDSLWAQAMHRAMVDFSGYRNAQVTLLAPTGTIGILMGCDTTGIEPAFALKTFKSLAGGGSIEATVKSAVEGMRALGWTEEAIERAESLIKEVGELDPDCDVDGVFACASGEHALSVDAHLNMMAAVQPFLSGGISKTVNVPNHYTVEDIEAVFVRAAKLGLKAVAVYRDGCKASQPLESVGKEEKAGDVATVEPQRRPVDRPAPATVHKLTVAGHTFYVTITRYLDGFGIAEVFISHSRDGGTLGGILNALARQISVALQYGVPVEALTKTMRDSKSEPAGFVQGHPRIRFCSSIADLIARLLEDEAGVAVTHDIGEDAPEVEPQASVNTGFLADPCTGCGEFRLVRNGTCLLCRACGSTSGCS